ncbi:unnamed protein product [Clavelina lepadiformis]|uniref:RGS domain-containing protein n=1 Tax=Clavelina lepadiformis TaxID=159417 RepID=A0ABP0G900_CLALP
MFTEGGKENLKKKQSSKPSYSSTVDISEGAYQTVGYTSKKQKDNKNKTRGRKWEEEIEKVICRECFSAYCSQTLAQYLLDRELFHKFWPAVETKMGEEMTK